jgi:hypothetical protein
MLEPYHTETDTKWIEHQIETSISLFDCIVMYRFTPTEKPCSFTP